MAFEMMQYYLKISVNKICLLIPEFILKLKSFLKFYPNSFHSLCLLEQTNYRQLTLLFSSLKWIKLYIFLPVKHYLLYQVVFVTLDAGKMSFPRGEKGRENPESKNDENTFELERTQNRLRRHKFRSHLFFKSVFLSFFAGLPDKNGGGVDKYLKLRMPEIKSWFSVLRKASSDLRGIYSAYCFA